MTLILSPWEWLRMSKIDSAVNKVNLLFNPNESVVGEALPELAVNIARNMILQSLKEGKEAKIKVGYGSFYAEIEQ